MSLTAGTGVALYAVPGRTADYWAWTIEAAPSAAFFGAGYLGAAASLALAARTREWQQARVVAVAAVALTSLTLLETLLSLGPFRFGGGGLREAVAWIWLGVYVALPPLALAAFVIQEHAGGSQEYGVELPALGVTRLALGGAGALLGAVGVGLLADWRWLAKQWPWPLPALPAGVVGAWLCTYAAGFLWFALRERDWRRIRIGALPAAIAVALDLAATGRLWESFDGGAATAVYLAVLSVLLLAIETATVVEERRLHSSTRTASAVTGSRRAPKVTCQVGALNAGESVTITIPVKATAVGTAKNTANATTKKLDSNPTNNKDTEKATINP